MLSAIFCFYARYLAAPRYDARRSPRIDREVAGREPPRRLAAATFAAKKDVFAFNARLDERKSHGRNQIDMRFFIISACYNGSHSGSCEFCRDLFAHFEAIGTYRRAYGSPDIAAVGTESRHALHGEFSDTPYGTFPARMCRGYDTGAVIGHKQGYAVGCVYHQRYLRQCCHESIDIDRVIGSGGVDGKNVQRMSLTGNYQWYSTDNTRKVAAACGNVTWIIACVVAHVEAVVGVTAVVAAALHRKGANTSAESVRANLRGATHTPSCLLRRPSRRCRPNRHPPAPVRFQ